MVNRGGGSEWCLLTWFSLSFELKSAPMDLGHDVQLSAIPFYLFGSMSIKIFANYSPGC